MMRWVSANCEVAIQEERKEILKGIPKRKCPEHPEIDGLICSLCNSIRKEQIEYLKKFKEEE